MKMKKQQQQQQADPIWIQIKLSEKDEYPIYLLRKLMRENLERLTFATFSHLNPHFRKHGEEEKKNI